jgi:RNA polymerase sigma-70 factor (ECF subfamily)
MDSIEVAADRCELADASLKTLLTAGQIDDRAFAELYQRTSRLVFLTVDRVLHDHAQADEVVQEVYLQAWERAATYRGDLSSVTTWLVTIAHRRAVDRVRHNESSKASENRDHRLSLARPADSAEAQVLQRVEVRRLREAMAQLTDAQRQAVTLSHLGGYSHAEIADLLNLPIGTVKSRVRQGLFKLKNALERRGNPRSTPRAT